MESSLRLPDTDTDSDSLPVGVRYEIVQELEIPPVLIRLGFVSTGLAYGHWYVQPHCTCVWTVGLSCCVPTPLFRPIRTIKWDHLLLDKVDVVLFVGCQPGSRHPIWENRSVMMVIWICEVGRHRRQPPSPPGWTTARHTIHHSTLGGVTTGRFTVARACRRDYSGALRWIWTHPSLSNTLSQVLNTTLPGSPATIDAVRGKGTVNTPLGLLDWANRTGWVYSRNVKVDKFGKWVRRHLAPKELMDALDIPASVSYPASALESTPIVDVPVPGKVISLVISLLSLPPLARPSNPSPPEQTFPDSCTPSAAPLLAAVGSPDNVSSYDLLFSRVSESVSAKATKSDDHSRVPDHIWNKFVVDGAHGFLAGPLLAESGHPTTMLRPCHDAFTCLVNWFRKWMLCHWKQKVIDEMDQWCATYGSSLPRQDILVKRCREVRYHVGCASWWNWERGSTLFFWRWPLQYMSAALYGVPPMFDSKPPRYWAPQPPFDDDVAKGLVKAKIQRVLERGYIQIVRVSTLKGLMFFFYVPKGEADIRLVYDGTKSGLNGVLWSPWFRLPSPEALFEVVMPDYWSTDNDYGDFFLNFPLHEHLKVYCGVDLSQLFTAEELKDLGVTELFLNEDLESIHSMGELLLAVWERMAMGLKPSPYNCVQFAGRSNRFILGDRLDASNPFAWELVRLNLPGTPNYKSSEPWIYKIRKDGKIAADLARFVDDLRNTGPTERLAWEASTRIGKISAWFGQQDAPRKRRTPSQNPGAWAATVVSTSDGLLRKCVTVEAWQKAQKRIKYLAYYARCDISKDDVDFNLEAELKIKSKGKGWLSHKIAEKYVGYLIHIAGTYDAVFPYLQGLYLTLNSWRDGRDDEGWIDMTWKKMHKELDKPDAETPKPPIHVKCVHRLKEDMRILLDFFSDEVPPKIPVRPSAHSTMYIIGDASGSGFGNMAWDGKEQTVTARFGGWNETVQAKSSNIREAYTAIMGIENQLKSGKIKKGTEVFIFTDNDTTEKVFSKGSSKSRELHELAVRLRRHQMRGEIFIHVIWVAGTRMIAQGTDSLSRGDLCSGVMAGDPFLDHIPLSQDAFVRRPQLLSWLKKTLNEDDWTWLDPKDWYTVPFEDCYGCYVWAPPPCIARKAIELMCEVHHIHPYTSHVFVCPTLMTYRWRKTLMKCSDVTFTLPACCSIWPKEMHEPLTISFVSPLLESTPWRMGRTGWLDERYYSQMREMLTSNPETARNCAPDDGFPVLAAQDMEDSLINDAEILEDNDPKRFKEARDGDHLMCPFQCDACQFRNIRGRDPIPGRAQDALAMVCLRRGTLDAFWSRERSTVQHNLNEMKKYLRASDLIGEEAPLSPMGPWRTDDLFGIRGANALLIRSLDEGRNAPKIQFGTVRKMRSCIANYAHASAGGLGETLIADERNTTAISYAESNTYWFRRFMIGLHKRMGDVWIPDRAITIEEVLAGFVILENDWMTASSIGDEYGKQKASLTAVIIIGGFFGGLRGEEIAKMDLGALRTHWDEATSQPLNKRHVPLMLAGRFKRETGEKVFCQPLAPITKTGVQILLWFQRLIFCLQT